MYLHWEKNTKFASNVMWILQTNYIMKNYFDLTGRVALITG